MEPHESTAFRIRPARPADLAECAALVCLHSGGEPPEVERRLGRELDRTDRALLVARAGDHATGPVVGYGRITWFTSGGADSEAPSGAYLGGLVVAPAHRGGGIGTALTRARMRSAFEEHRENAVWYFANARNHASIALHERFGFREVTRDFWYPGITFEGGTGILFRAPAPAPAPASEHEGAH